MKVEMFSRTLALKSAQDSVFLCQILPPNGLYVSKWPKL